MAKRVDPLKAKEAKQKKIAIGGVVILLALLGIQGPKTLKMLKGPQAPEAPAAIAPTTTTTGAVPAPAPATSGGTTTAAPSGGAELTSVADSDAAPTIEPGQLATFERFSSKDPFAQQAEAVPVVTPAPKPNDDSTDGAAAEDGGKPTEGEPAEGGGAPTGGFTTDGGEPDPAPQAPELAQATSIAVNGAAEDVALEAAFPKDEPTFVLVSVAKNGKSVEIGIAGGEYATGGETMTLALGKKITLQNTADGSRYEIELLSIQGSPLPKKKS
jgi:hypothetical protein